MNHPFGNYGGGAAGGGQRDNMNPNDMMSDSYASPSFQPQHNFHHASNPMSSNSAFSGGSALFGDDELLAGLASPTDDGTGHGPHSHAHPNPGHHHHHSLKKDTPRQ